MTVYDFLYMFNDDSITCAIYDTTTEEEVFKGTVRGAMYSDYESEEVDGVDLDDGIILVTITTAEEEENE